MFTIASLWIPFTIIAALGQVARNAMQRSLTGPLGTWGATNIRFLFGFPFSIVFFVVVVAVTGDRVPWPAAAFWPWLLLGALSQIVAARRRKELCRAEADHHRPCCGCGLRAVGDRLSRRHHHGVRRFLRDRGVL